MSSGDIDLDSPNRELYDVTMPGDDGLLRGLPSISGRVTSTMCSSLERRAFTSCSDFPGVYALQSSGTFRATHWNRIYVKYKCATRHIKLACAQGICLSHCRGGQGHEHILKEVGCTTYLLLPPMAFSAGVALVGRESESRMLASLIMYGMHKPDSSSGFLLSPLRLVRFMMDLALGRGSSRTRVRV